MPCRWSPTNGASRAPRCELRDYLHAAKLHPGIFRRAGIRAGDRQALHRLFIIKAEKKLRPGAVVVADNVGISGSSTDDYLKLVRSKYKSQTEWFDVDLPWAKRDAMEVTRITQKQKGDE